MIYYTGDIHGETFWVVRFCKRMRLTKDDTVVILGDVAANYFENEQDLKVKSELGKLKPTILCIHGNHECRPEHIPTYKTKEWNGGLVWYEDQFPNLLFAKDGEIYTMGGLRHLVIGGAYSIDVQQRLRYHWQWWADEQPSAETKAYVEQQIRKNKIDVILSHTCPAKYAPTEAFLPGYDQSQIDNSTEQWLDRIEETADYLAWYCGHWHIDKRIDRMHFLSHSFESCEPIQELALVKAMNDREIGTQIERFNTLTSYGIQYALRMPGLAADSMKRIIADSLDILHENTKAEIVVSIEDYISKHKTVSDLDTWNEIIDMIDSDLEGSEINGENTLHW